VERCKTHLVDLCFSIARHLNHHPSRCVCTFACVRACACARVFVHPQGRTHPHTHAHPRSRSRVNQLTAFPPSSVCRMVRQTACHCLCELERSFPTILSAHKPSVPPIPTPIHTRTRAHTPTQPHAHTRTRMHVRVHAHTCTHMRTHLEFTALLPTQPPTRPFIFILVR
jgi:hypothetical protein